MSITSLTLPVSDEVLTAEMAGPSSTAFRLEPQFLGRYHGRRPRFGFHGLGEFVFYRTYARSMPDGRKESFTDVLTRVVEGCFEILRRHCERRGIAWNSADAQRTAQEMFARMWEFKLLPPGRALWMMGTPYMWERGGAALNNCGFVSTAELASDPADPFCFVMDMSLLGVGVGFDTKGSGRLLIGAPGSKTSTHRVEDSREGWVDSLRMLIESYTTRRGEGRVGFDYSALRAAGQPIKGFGGKAGGPEPLRALHDEVRNLLEARVGSCLSSVDIVDLMNLVGRCAVGGNGRRAAEIAFGSPDDVAYVSMKDHTQHAAELNHHRWVSNNSVFGQVGMDYTALAEQLAVNGEPGLIWLANIQNYGRMADGCRPGIDGLALGSNPCGEQSLESHELCCLVETFPAKHTSAADYHRTLRFAMLYAKSVTLLATHNVHTNAVMSRNRRVGVSQSGIVQAFAKFGRDAVLADFCDRGYTLLKQWDAAFSDWLGVPRSIKLTSVKPSGTVSLLAGATPGIHHPEAASYWRRVRVLRGSVLARVMAEAGYQVEPDVADPRNTAVITFAVTDEHVRPVAQVSLREQVQNAADYQAHWADNQVSCTVKFRPEDASQIAPVLAEFDTRLKGISFLPMRNHGYAQAPYEPCTPDDVRRYHARLKPIDFGPYLQEDAVGSHFCDGEVCQLV